MGRLLLFYHPVDQTATTRVMQSLRDVGHRLQVVRVDTQNARWQVVARQYDAAIFVVSPQALYDTQMRQHLMEGSRLGLHSVAVAARPIGNALGSMPCVDISPHFRKGIQDLLNWLTPQSPAPAWTTGSAILASLVGILLLALLGLGVLLLAGSRGSADHSLPTLDMRLSTQFALANQPQDTATQAVAGAAEAPADDDDTTDTPQPLASEAVITPASGTEETGSQQSADSTPDPLGTLTPIATGDAVSLLTLTPPPGLIITATSQPSIDDDAPGALFFALPTRGEAPLTVIFENDSWGDIVAYAWDFNGDGRIDSTAANPPPYTYVGEGTFIASLRVTGSDGATDTESMEITVYGADELTQPTATMIVPPTISVATPTQQLTFEAPGALFYADPTRGEAPLTVTFENDSWGDIVAYAWDFNGDGRVDSNASSPPPYTYTSEGTFTAILRVTGADGSTDQSTMEIVVFGPLIETPRTGTPPPVIPSIPTLGFTATPTTTPTSTLTATQTATLTRTPAPTATRTSTPTREPEVTADVTEPPMETSTATMTLTLPATATATEPATATSTEVPTATATEQPTQTNIPTLIPTVPTPLPTQTPLPATTTPIPPTATPEPTATTATEESGD